jgi:hypothetical protein
MLFPKLIGDVIRVESHLILERRFNTLVPHQRSQRGRLDLRRPPSSKRPPFSVAQAFTGLCNC